MGRIARGFRLIGVSWNVLQQDRELMLLPVLSFLSIAVVAIPLSIGLYSSGLFAPDAQPRALHYATLFVFYFISYFISIFFNAALIGAAMIRLDGGNPTLGDGVRLAMERIEKILGWALIAATVGMVLRSMEERAGLLGRIVISIISVAWAAVTYFVVPVLVFEPVGVRGSIKRSAQLFKQRWGETFVGNGAIGAATALIAIPVMIAVVMLFVAQPVVGVLVGVATLGFLMSFSAAISGIFNAALYRYAVSGAIAGGFTEGDLRSAFRPRGRRGRGMSLRPASPFDAGGVFSDLDPEVQGKLQERLTGTVPPPTAPAGESHATPPDEPPPAGV